jgi:S1-C subfamily serine protease
MKRLFLAFITGVALIGTTWTAFAATLFSLVILLALTASCFADGSGSGFVVRKEGYVVTNHHVIEDAKEIWVKVPGKTIDFRASVVIDDSVHDLTLLKI